MFSVELKLWRAKLSPRVMAICGHDSPVVGLAGLGLLELVLQLDNVPAGAGASAAPCPVRGDEEHHCKTVCGLTMWPHCTLHTTRYALRTTACAESVKTSKTTACRHLCSARNRQGTEDRTFDSSWGLPIIPRPIAGIAVESGPPATCRTALLVTPSAIANQTHVGQSEKECAGARS